MDSPLIMTNSSPNTTELTSSPAPQTKAEPGEGFAEAMQAAEKEQINEKPAVDNTATPPSTPKETKGQQESVSAGQGESPESVETVETTADTTPLPDVVIQTPTVLEENTPDKQIPFFTLPQQKAPLRNLEVPSLQVSDELVLEGNDQVEGLMPVALPAAMPLTVPTEIAKQLESKTTVTVNTAQPSLNPISVAMAPNGQMSSLSPSTQAVPLQPSVGEGTAQQTQANPLVSPSAALATSTQLFDGAKQSQGEMGLGVEGDLVAQLASDGEDTEAFTPLMTRELGGKPMAASESLNAANKAQFSVTIPFKQGDGQWGTAVSERVAWMSSQGIKEAEIHLDPPELGPLQVKVTMDKETAHVSFVTQHASVKEALDQSVMRLREMLEEEGISQVNVDVSDQSQQQADSNEGAEGGQEGGLAEGEASVMETPISSSAENYSLVDAYA